MFFLNIALYVLCLTLSGCGHYQFQPPVRYSHKIYTVRNSFGKHTYKPDKHYKINGWYRNGRASYYGGKFHGRKTASCIVYDENQLLAAHPTAVIPSIAKVTRLDKNKSIYVIIVDRGPFAKGRICDLSVGAAKALDGFREGHVPIKIEILPQNSHVLAKNWKKFLHKKLPNELFKYLNNPTGLASYLNKIK